MKTTDLKTRCALTLAVCGVLAGGPALADPPPRGDSGNARKSQHVDRRDEQRGERHERENRSREKRQHFEDRQRMLVHTYYEDQFRHGHCPYGLSKKHNGCMPPGQARKWQVGRPLPRDLIFHNLPDRLVVELGPPPSGYRFVRVASDILLIAIGTGIVIDAIEDLGR